MDCTTCKHYNPAEGLGLGDTLMSGGVLYKITDLVRCGKDNSLYHIDAAQLCRDYDLDFSTSPLFGAPQCPNCGSKGPFEDRVIEKANTPSHLETYTVKRCTKCGRTAYDSRENQKIKD